MSNDKINDRASTLATKDDPKLMELRLTMKMGALIAAGIGIVATVTKLLN